jgi:GxxExxY protein
VRHFERWTPACESDPLTYAIIGCAIDVHKVLGPGLRESAYEESLSYALHKEGLLFVRQAFLPAVYEEINLEKAYRPDLIVNKEVVVEIKTVKHLLPVHDSQLLTYLRFSKIQRGLLLNFQVRRMISGVRRLVLTR